MKDRLKALRNELNLTQQAFADRIGVKRNTVATYEMGRNEPTDPVIKIICDTFHVNEVWLRTGEGEMRVEIPKDDELMALINKSMNEESGEIRRRIATAVMNLSPEQLRACTDWIKSTFNLVDAPKPDKATHDLYLANAAHQRTDVPYNDEDQKFDDDIMDDENF